MNNAYKTALTRKRKNKAARHIQKAVRTSQTIKKARVGSAAAKRDYYIVKINLTTDRTGRKKLNFIPTLLENRPTKGQPWVPIKHENEPVGELEITWSPDEKHVVVSNTDDLTRIFCIDADNQECNGKVVFYALGGVVSAFWSDNQTAYVRYGNMGNDIVSRLIFPSDTTYPKEQIIYEEPWNAFFAYRPASISPNNIYLVMERRYEGPPILAIMNTQTGKIIELRKNDELYVLGSNPNYTWNGSLLTFTGGLTTGGSWLELADETQAINDSLLEEITLDASTLN